MLGRHLVTSRALRRLSTVHVARLLSGAGYPATSLPPVVDTARVPPALAALASAPCLQCGAAKSSAAVSPASLRAVSGLHLACSPECADTFARTHPKLVQQYQSIAEDAAYSTSDLAKRLFAQVLPNGAAQRRALAAAAEATFPHVDSWEEFLKLHTADAQWRDDPRAVRLVSAAYSFVMTLSYFLPALGDASGAPDAFAHDIGIHVVGARAEAMMPRHFWDELALFHPSARAFDIKLIGDHVPALRKKRTAQPEPPQQMSPPQSRVRLENINGLYHEAQVAECLQVAPHAFVLFNPGIGHPFLKARWRPTIAALLASGKPMLLSSFSEVDQERDIAALRELDAHVAFVVPPQRNPFRSLKVQLDPLNLTAPIQTNCHVMVVQRIAAPVTP